FLHCALLFSSLFFFMPRRPPRSTLFPYRRSSDLRKPALYVIRPITKRKKNVEKVSAKPNRISSVSNKSPPVVKNKVQYSNHVSRSEEHTSELQSRENLVCRLLLEKKKKKKNKEKKKNITKQQKGQKDRVEETTRAGECRTLEKPRERREEKRKAARRRARTR